MKPMKKTLIYSALVALVVSLASIGIFSYLTNDAQKVTIEHIASTPSSSVLYSLDENGEAVPLDFTATAEKVVNAVVHIKSTQAYMAADENQQYRNLPDPFRDFFGERFFNMPQEQRQPRPRVGTGSGVIINDNGYIVTNNHVIANADDIEVTLYDNRTCKADVIGTDPTTDLALIQIKEKDLPTLPFVNSEDVKVGQWVMAVGNPFSLNSTVTAGIVSAKGRSINILREQYAVENFIQTDAVINPGNSGGALVNLDGGLVGINTAIASPTGAYSGYGFAVPSNIVNKVVEDLLKYGVVQRGVLGVMIRSVNGNLAKAEGLDRTTGVYVDSLLENSAAGEAGIEIGDIIIAVEGATVNTSAELQGAIAQYRPGEKVSVTIVRDGDERTFDVVLNNRAGTTELATKAEIDILKVLGADFKAIDKSKAQSMGIKGGVQVVNLFAGELRKQTKMQEGFIITEIDGQAVTSVDEVVAMLEDKSGGVMLAGIYENVPGVRYYAIGLSL